MNAIERRIIRLEDYRRGGRCQDDAVRHAWLRTVSDDDVERAAAIQEHLRDGGDPDALSPQERALMGRLDADFSTFRATRW